ncbi:MAG: biotin transporter BioY [Clostridia bacterium]
MNRQVKMLSYSALMCALIIVSTLWFKFGIPGTDVLVTTQVFFVLLCGQLLPARYCLYTMGAYLFIGLVGVPVFSAAAGPAVLATPSFGYLLGFPFAAAAVSIACGKLKQIKGGRLIASLIGVVVNYVIALLYIAALKGLYLGTPVPIGTLLFAYCFAFLPLDIVKAVLAALLAMRLEKPLHLNELA